MKASMNNLRFVVGDAGEGGGETVIDSEASEEIKRIIKSQLKPYIENMVASILEHSRQIHKVNNISGEYERASSSADVSPQKGIKLYRRLKTVREAEILASEEIERQRDALLRALDDISEIDVQTKTKIANALGLIIENHLYVGEVTIRNYIEMIIERAYVGAQMPA